MPIVLGFIARLRTTLAHINQAARNLPGIIGGVFRWVGNRSFTLRGTIRFVIISFATVFTTAVVVGLVLVYYPSTQLPELERVQNLVYLDQGWGRARDAKDRQTYYYTPQGTSLKGLRYSWFKYLERPKDETPFADPDHMRAYGFLVDDAPTPETNPDQMPVGFARHWDPDLQDDVLDITCAACHTGQLNIQRNGQTIGIRIDGGPAMHAFTAVRIGHFVPELIGSLIITYLDPPTFYRFAHNVLGPRFPHGWLQLHSDLGDVTWAFLKQGWIERSKHLYPVEEGFGRTDAIGRISNTVFGDHISESNYRVGDAPVSYPAVWDIYKFDWVQYGASVKHPLARNIGESMGVGSTYKLVDYYGRPVRQSERFVASSLVHQISSIEATLHQLQPPRWPEDLLGPIDCKKAMLGKYLFNRHCWGCHGPHLATDEDTMIDAPGKLQRSPRMLEIAHASGFDHLTKTPFPHWKMKILSIDDIGTDPNAALNFVNRRIDLSRTGVTTAEVQALEQPLLEEDLARRVSVCTADAERVKAEGRKTITQKLDALDIKSVSIGAGLNIFGLLIRKQYREDPRYRAAEYGMPKPGLTEGADDDIFFSQIDLPQTPLGYKARPLAGAWATAPYLHNGSVPTLYQMLLPADQRSKRFFVGRKLFDPKHVGFVLDPLSKGGFWLDTSIPGNHNTGHEFRAGYVNLWEDTAPEPPKEIRACAEDAPDEPNIKPSGPCDQSIEVSPPQYGVIGPELSEKERWAIIEYLKIRRDPPDNNEFPEHCYCRKSGKK
jgi:hypothetical protein